jgi:LPXTG-motif cell wall-anchored protein
VDGNWSEPSPVSPTTTVKKDNPPLPSTGASPTIFLWLAALFIAIGTAMTGREKTKWNR